MWEKSRTKLCCHFYDTRKGARKRGKKAVITNPQHLISVFSPLFTLHGSIQAGRIHGHALGSSLGPRLLVL